MSWVAFQHNDVDAMIFLNKCNEDNLTNVKLIERAKQEGAPVMGYGYNGLKETGEEERFKLPYNDDRASERFLCRRLENGECLAPVPAVMLTFTPENKRNAIAYHKMLAKKRAERTPEQVEADAYSNANCEPGGPNIVEHILQTRHAFVEKFNKEWPSHWRKEYGDAYWKRLEQDAARKKILDSYTSYNH